MKIEFDPAKDKSNIAKHGISLSRAGDLDIKAFRKDERFDYGEDRYLAWGYIDDVAHCLAFADRDGVVRAISLRRAHKKEMNRNAS